MSEIPVHRDDSRRPPLPSPGVPGEGELGLLPVATLVVWCGCLTIGFVGIILANRKPKPLPPVLVETELINVEAVGPQVALAPAEEVAQPASAVPPPPVVPEIAPPSTPPAFEQPMDQPQFKPIPRPVVAATKPVNVATTKPVVAQPVANPGVIHLTYGEGEGDQPPPEEPPEAVRDGEEGTVVVRMTVGEEGRVIEAEAVSPCRWPLLNSAAVHAIRRTWRFRRGPVRVYDVAIEFDINRQ
jgi:protein TonB